MDHINKLSFWLYLRLAYLRARQLRENGLLAFYCRLHHLFFLLLAFSLQLIHLNSIFLVLQPFNHIVLPIIPLPLNQRLHLSPVPQLFPRLLHIPLNLLHLFQLSLPNPLTLHLLLLFLGFYSNLFLLLPLLS